MQCRKAAADDMEEDGEGGRLARCCRAGRRCLHWNLLLLLAGGGAAMAVMGALVGGVWEAHAPGTCVAAPPPGPGPAGNGSAGNGSAAAGPVFRCRDGPPEGEGAGVYPVLVRNATSAEPTGYWTDEALDPGSWANWTDGERARVLAGARRCANGVIAGPRMTVEHCERVLPHLNDPHTFAPLYYPHCSNWPNKEPNFCGLEAFTAPRRRAAQRTTLGLACAGSLLFVLAVAGLCRFKQVQRREGAGNRVRESAGIALGIPLPVMPTYAAEVRVK